jgi:tRNA pseudouridine(55) synthase
MVLNLYKKPGETPLECLNRFRLSYPEYTDAVLSYVGRLDPLAEGVLLVVAGEENKNREKYLNLSKEYIVDIVFGFETDTGDCLGLVINTSNPNPDMGDIEKIIKSFEGKHIQQYPIFSSKTVKGKPLREWARENRINEIEIPSQEIAIASIELLKKGEITKRDFEKSIFKKINSVSGEFRQMYCIDSWNKTLQKNTSDTFTLVQIKVQCSSGTYMRVLSGKIGEKLGTNALAYHICRTKVAHYSLSDALM